MKLECLRGKTLGIAHQCSEPSVLAKKIILTHLQHFQKMSVPILCKVSKSRSNMVGNAKKFSSGDQTFHAHVKGWPEQDYSLSELTLSLCAF